MNTMTLMQVLEIVHRHDPEGSSMAASHDKLVVCGDLPFTPEEAAELDDLGLIRDESEDCWFTFV